MTESYCGVSGMAADGEPPPPPPPEPIAKTPIGARASTAVAAAPQIILEAIVGILRVVPSGAIMARTIGAVMTLSRRVNLALTMLAQAVCVFLEDTPPSPTSSSPASAGLFLSGDREPPNSPRPTWLAWPPGAAY